MKKLTIVSIAILLLGSALACNVSPPDVDFSVPTLEVGETREERHTIPLNGIGAADVGIIFGAGKFELEAGVSDKLLSGLFRYNVAQWAPEIKQEGDELTIKQGGKEQNWGIPTGNVRNKWDLEFSPEALLAMDIKLGAGSGELDFTDLQLTALDVNIGAGDYSLRFGSPNQAEMEKFTLNAGASKLEVLQVGNANPEQLRVKGGVGDIGLDLSGTWTHSSEVKVLAGAGSLTVRVPDDMGVLVETKGPLSKVESSDLRRVGDTYVNDAFGKAEKELHVRITTGVGSVRLLGVAN